MRLLLLLFVLLCYLGASAAYAASLPMCDTFDSGTDGWTGTGISNDSQRLRIARDSTASKNYDFTVSEANRDMVVSFAYETEGGWESSGGSQDYIRMDINSVELFNDSPVNGSYSDSFTATTDASGQLLFDIEVDTTADGEVAFFDNICFAAVATSACPDDSSYPLIFSDDFSDGNRDGWTPIEFDYSISNYPGEAVSDVGQTSNTEWANDWTVFSGELWWNRGGGSGSADEYGMLSYDLSGSHDITAITEYSITADLNGYPDIPNNNQNNDMGIVFGYTDDSNYYLVRWTKFGDYYSSSPAGYPGTFRRLTLVQVSSGTATILGTRVDFYDADNFELKVTVRPSGIYVCVDGVQEISYTGAGRPALNLIGLYSYDNDHGITFDDVVVRALTLQCFNDDFNRVSLGSDWAVSNSGGSFGNPAIVNGRLRLTDSSNSVATAASLLRLFPGAGNEIVYEFDHYAYDGTGADGIAITLSDASVTPSPGGYGGSLGYAQRCGIDGFAGGWLGIGIDEYGNFRNDEECRGDGGALTGRVQDSVSVRGSGSGQTGYLLHGESGALSPLIDDPSNTSASYGHRYRITVNHTDNTHAYVTLERDTGSGFNTIIPTYDASAQSGQVAVPSNWLISMTGSTGGSRNIHEIDNLEVCATSMLPYTGIDHYRFYHDGAGITCAPETIQIKACLDVDCTVEFAGNLDATLSPTGWVGGDSQTFLSSDTVQLWNTSAGSVVLDIAGNSAEAVAVKPPRCFIGATEQVDCSLEFFDSGFIFDVPDVTACQTSSAVSIQAVRTDLTSQTCVANSNFANTNTSVNFWSSYLNPVSGTSQVNLSGADIATSSPGTGISLSFDGTATANFTVNYPDAGQMQLNASYIGTVGDPDEGVVLTGNDSFVSRPVGLCVESTDANAGCVSGDGSCSEFITVDQGFNLTVRAVCWEASGDTDFCDNTITPNYEQNGIPITHTLVAPTSAGSSAGTIGVNSVDIVDTDNGTHAINNQTISEVGVFRFTATPPDYFGTALPAATSSNIGRFTPDHFETAITANGSFANACTAFTYVGQPFGYAAGDHPELTITATDSGGGTTVNYRDDFVKLTNPVTQIGYPGVTSDASTLGADAATLMAVTMTPVAGNLVANDDGTLLYTFGADQFVYDRDSNSLVAPFTSNLQVPVSSVVDSDGISASDLPRSALPTGILLNYGRMAIPNAYGPETLPLTLTLTTEYFNGTGFITNVVDSCTDYTLGNLSVNDGEVDDLSAAETTPSDTDLVNNTLTSGLGTDFQLSAPSTGDSGSVGLVYDLDTAGLSWLKPLDATGTPQNPTAKATFGIYKGNERLIYMRESVQ